MGAPNRVKTTAEPLIDERLWGFIKAITNSGWILCKWFTLTAGDFGKGAEAAKGNGR